MTEDSRYSRAPDFSQGRKLTPILPMDAIRGLFNCVRKNEKERIIPFFNRLSATLYKTK